MFRGREKELKRLDLMYKSNRFEFAIFYGRRRIGKTTLINHFIKYKRYIFFASQKTSKEENLIELSRQISALTGFDIAFSSFIDAFRAVIKLAKEERLIFVIDEYPYLMKENRDDISSILQNLIDNEAKETKLFLILAGSSLSFMEDNVLGKESPLYGRATAIFKIKPFDYLTSSKFVPRYSCEDKALVYGITGGIPRYLELFSDEITIKENLLFNFFDSNSILFNERDNFLKEEFKEVSTYNAILSAIANGSTKLAEIADKAGIQVGTLPIYLNKLKEIGAVDKQVPIGNNERRGIWTITDLFLRFYFFFVPRNISTIVSGRMESAYDQVVEPFLSDYMGKVFERISIEYISLYADLPFPLKSIGSWWGGSKREKKEIETLIVATSAIGNDLIIGSVKYRKKEVGVSELELMREYSSEIGITGNFHYWFFSRSGFDDEMKSLSDNTIRLITIDDIFRDRL